MTSSNTSIAVANARASAWLPPSHASDGASAPVAARAHPAPVAHNMTVRRPRRSAAAAMTKARTPTTRTTPPATPCAVLLAWNSSAAKLDVWLNKVLRYPATTPTAASVAKTVVVRRSKRSLGIHHAGPFQGGLRNASQIGTAKNH